MGLSVTESAERVRVIDAVVRASRRSVVHSLAVSVFIYFAGDVREPGDACGSVGGGFGGALMSPLARRRRGEKF